MKFAMRKLHTLLCLTLCTLPALADAGPQSPKALFELAQKRFEAKDWPGFFELWSPASLEAMTADRKAWSTAFPKASRVQRAKQLQILGVENFEAAQQLSDAQWSGAWIAANDRINGGPFGKTAGFVSIDDARGITMLLIRYLAKRAPFKRTHRLRAVKLGSSWYFRAVNAGEDYNASTIRRMLLEMIGSWFQTAGMQDPKQLKQLQESLDKQFDKTVRMAIAADLRRAPAARQKLLLKTNAAIDQLSKQAAERKLQLSVPANKLLAQKQSGKDWTLFRALVLEKLLVQQKK